MEPLRMGVVGPGLIWKKAHRPVLELLADTFRIAAFAASSDKTRREVAESYPNLPFFWGYEDLVRSPEIDVVLVLTPIALNAPVALAALQAGKDVFLEKPMGRTLDEGRELIRAARQTKKRLWVLEQDAYRRSTEIIREIVRSGELGAPVLYEHVLHSPIGDRYDPNSYAAMTWRKRAEFPLGTLFDGGHHSLAVHAEIWGAPRSVYAVGRQLDPEYGEYGHVLMLFDYASGLRGVFSHASHLGSRRNYFHIRGTEAILTVGEDRQRLLIERHDGTQREVALPTEVAHERMWRALAQCVREGCEPAYTMESAYRELATLYAVDESIHDGRAAPIEWAVEEP